MDLVTVALWQDVTDWADDESGFLINKDYPAKAVRDKICYNMSQALQEYTPGTFVRISVVAGCIANYLRQPEVLV